MNADEKKSDQPQLSRRRLLAGGAGMLAGVGMLASTGFTTGSARAQTETGSDDASAGTTPHGKVALVTGSSRGIGAAIARRLGREGYRVAVNCVASTDLAAQVARDIESNGSEAIWRRADVRDPAALGGFFDDCEQAFGGIDVVVANAGVMHLAPFAEMTDEMFNHMIDVNVRGSFHTLREAARRVRDGGRIITLSSTITKFRTETYGPYTASKAAQDMYASVLAKELGGRNISVNSIAPGVVNTPLFTDGKTEDLIARFAQRTPHGRIGEPEDIADVVAMLCSGDGYWVNGETLYANGGIA